VSDDREIRAYYELGREAGRLTDWGRLEFLRTTELLARFLPPPPAVVLDVGGAAGAYALPLAEQGYEVHLVDPVALHVEQALAASASVETAPLASAEVGDARRLATADASVDVVLMLGPLYHLTAASDRGRALAEAQHRNPDHRPHWFTTAYFHRPDELQAEVDAAGFEVGALLAVEGPAGALAEAGALDAWLGDDRRRALLLRAIRRVEAEPSLLGASPHVLAIATRP
jgi:SAM-dependent methyltransferase